MSSLADADKFTKDKSLDGNCTHGAGQAPAEYGIKYIPHKVLVDKDGNVVKNFDLKLPDDLEPLLAK
jgi:hypothetical protein